MEEDILSVERLESYWKLKKETKYDGLNSKMIDRMVSAILFVFLKK